MMTKQEYRNDCIILKTIEEIVPKEHLVRKLDAAIDLKFVEDEVENLYSAFGKPSIPPMVLFKLLIINYMFEINSMRKTCEECEANMAYRWYLGISIDDKVPNYSTWNQNYIRRYRGTKIFKTIFKKILKQAREYKMLKMKTVYGDGTHLKASANKNKYEDKEIELEAKSYDEKLLKEINKKGFEYIKESDCYICPTGEILEVRTVDKQGYKIYRSNKKCCEKCKLREKCTKSKNSQKVITRHVWQDYKEEVNVKRYEEIFKTEYPKRKQTIERVFGDCKEQHSLRYTRVRGLEKNSNQALLIFACHNLKKMSLWRWETLKKEEKSPKNIVNNSTYLEKLIKIINNCIEKVISLFRTITLSTV